MFAVYGLILDETGERVLVCNERLKGRNAMPRNSREEVWSLAREFWTLGGGSLKKNWDASRR